jgi:hypothetical protein
MVPGKSPDTARPSDVALMGQTLARLHRSLATIPTIVVGQVAALEVVDLPEFDSAPQLLHGDFSAPNLR